MAQILAMKHRHPSVGPKKIRDRLRAVAPAAAWPVDSTVGVILYRAGLVRARRRRVPADPPRAEPGHGGGPAVECGLQRGLSGGHGATVLSADGAGSRQPVSAAVSRLAASHHGGSAAVVCVAVSRVWAASHDPHGQRAAQQRRFEAFVQEYNWERSHEALDRRTPGRVHQPSPRPYPVKLPPIEDAPGTLVRQVRHNGEVRWRGHVLYLSEVLAQEPVGFTPRGREPLGDPL